MRLFNDSPNRNKELVHPILLEKDDNDNYLFSKKVTRNYTSEVYEPKWSRVDAKSYSPDFSSPYIPEYNRSSRERIIPLRTVFSEKPPAYATFRPSSRSSTTNLRTSNLRTDFPQFSNLNSPSKIASTLGRK